MACPPASPGPARCSIRSTCVVVLGLVLAGAAGAAPDEPADGDVRQARVHYQKATSAYGLGHYDEAAVEYEKAFELKSDPALLFNAAQAHRLAGNRARALLLYQNYLRLYGRQVKNREEVERRVLELKAAVDAGVPARAAPPIDPEAKPPGTPGSTESAPSPRPPFTGPPASRVTPTAVPPAAVSAAAPPGPPVTRKPWFWAVIGTGAAVVVGAVIVGAVLGAPPADPTVTIGTAPGN